MKTFAIYVQRPRWDYNILHIEAKDEDEALQKAQDFCYVENNGISHDLGFNSNWQEGDCPGDITLSGDVDVIFDEQDEPQ